jgi:hypothetical protein
LGRVVGRKPSPRALVYGFEGRDEVADAVAGLFPTARRIGSADEVRQDEYDVVVTDLSLAQFDDRLFAICFGSTNVGRYSIAVEGYVHTNRLEFQGTSIASEFIVPADLPPELLELVERQLVPLARSRDTNRILTLTTQLGPLTPVEEGQRYTKVHPILQTTEPELLAARILRPNGTSVWALPRGVTDEVAWVRTALSVWHRTNSEIFPTDPGWRDSPEWMTDEELSAMAARDSIVQERTAAVTLFQERLTDAEAELAAAHERAAAGPGLLLTGSGNALVGAVQEALEVLGFEVTNQDEINPPSDRLEDLRIKSPSDDPDWIALAEVRGYAKGAAQGDLLRLSARFAKRFIQEVGRDASALWYVVNQFAGTDPSSRPPPLDTNPGEVAAFQEEAGVVIATTSLFDLRKNVESGEVSPEDARRLMMEARGRWPAENPVG